jgi:hypothetical protein
MSKHTPSPWQVERTEQDRFEPVGGHYTSPANFLTVFMDHGNEMEGSNYADIHGPNQQANASLILAAPELLGALIKMVEHFERVDAAQRSRTIISEACAAIAKANDPTPRFRDL